MTHIKTPEEIAREVIEKNYGIGSPWEEPNDFGEEGFTRAQAESDIDADDIRGLIKLGITTDRSQRSVLNYDTLDQLLSAWDGYDGDVSGFYDAWINHVNEGAELPEWAKQD